MAANYALDESRKTVLRASYSRYAGQLNALDVLANNQVGAYYPYLAYRWVDLNGDHFAQRNEVLVNEGVQYSSVIDPVNPASTTPVNQIDPDYTREQGQRVDRGDRARAACPTSRSAPPTRTGRSSDIPSWFPRIGLTRADYTINPPVTVTNAQGTFTAQTYSPDPDQGRGHRRRPHPDQPRPTTSASSTGSSCR